MRGRSLLAIGLLALGLLVPSTALAAGDDADFAAARRTLLRQLKGRNPEARAEAVRGLVERPPADAVRLLVEVGLPHQDVAIREESYKEGHRSFDRHAGPPRKAKFGPTSSST
jgi:hypothetical protein